MSVNFHQAKRRNNPEDSHFHEKYKIKTLNAELKVRNKFGDSVA
jgi:hypothetical protein